MLRDWAFFSFWMRGPWICLLGLESFCLANLAIDLWIYHLRRDNTFSPGITGHMGSEQLSRKVYYVFIWLHAIPDLPIWSRTPISSDLSQMVVMIFWYPGTMWWESVDWNQMGESTGQSLGLWSSYLILPNHHALPWRLTSRQLALLFFVAS